jgi:hypothetical protein
VVRYKQYTAVHKAVSTSSVLGSLYCLLGYRQYADLLLTLMLTPRSRAALRQDTQY